ncbi:hypothetical protein AA450_24810, partial [Salmonella enterica subsp. enterica serovar Give]|nr:hypothetical protein [Salmonella enterica subsp. enterica serovar Give]
GRPFPLIRYDLWLSGLSHYALPFSMSARHPQGRPRRFCPPRSQPTAFTLSHINTAYTWLCKSRRRFPANADIWHLRFHRNT